MILTKIVRSAQSRGFYNPFIYTFLNSDKVVARPVRPSASINKQDFEKYHLLRREQRGLLFSDIKEDKPLEGVSFCSVGSGFAGEEFLIKNEVKELTLIEPDNFAASFLREIFGKDAQVVELPYQYFHPENQYDIIYTSGLGSWMNSNPFVGVENDLMKFCRNYLKNDGLFIALIGGALHFGYLLDKKYYIDNLITSLRNYGFYPIVYGKYDTDSAILVASKNASIQVEKIKNHAKELYVDRGNITIKEISNLRKAANAVFISFLIVGYMFMKIGVVVRETISLIKINIKLAG
jgi:hypothetical protein